MPLKLSSLITEVSGIGPAKAKLLSKLGIHFVRDLLYLFPRRYDDWSKLVPIAQLKEADKVVVQGRVKVVTSEWGWRGRKRMLRIFALIEDDTGIIEAIWYNMRFLLQELHPGRQLYLAGTVEKSAGKNIFPEHDVPPYMMKVPLIEWVKTYGQRIHTARITPTYPETAGVTSRFLRYHIQKLLPLVNLLPEYIPNELIKKYHLLGIHSALQAIHFPSSSEQLTQAEQRLRFDELFFLQLSALVRRAHREQRSAYAIKVSTAAHKKFIAQLPFSLTNAQVKALAEALTDLKRSVPMNRLLHGDVGSGKSVVALILIHHVLSDGYKALYLAPTEILARQHYELLKKSLKQYHVSLLVGSLTLAEKNAVKNHLQSDAPICIVGTHALLQEDVMGHKVALTVIDEQHRFGVAQRAALSSINSGENSSVPHLLSMTATPIPRTLNLTVYGDLDVSVLDQLPAGRQPITTRLVAPAEREQAIIEVLSQLHQGRQGYVIAPLINDAPISELKSAKAAFIEMKALFPGIKIGLMHGQLPAADKEAVMQQFSQGHIQLLVSTAIVEVGVNVPNASVMIIEGAERFGLAQLHQFRGRIGRDEYPSTCYLFPTTAKAADSERLKILERTKSGFVIAEEDLRLRGPGEVYGLEQSGFSDLKVASLLDYAAITQARQAAQEVLTSDPDLKLHSILRRKVAQKNKLIHLE